MTTAPGPRGPLACTALCLTLLAADSLAAPRQDLSAIADAASSAALAVAQAAGFSQVSARPRPLDPRLQLAECDVPLRAETNPNAAILGRTNVGVRCDGREPWAIYVRLEVTATAEVPVLATSLPRGTVLAAGDLELRSRSLTSDYAAVVRDPAQLIGKALDRDAAAGQELRHHDVSAPRVIERGQLVTLIAGRPGLEVQMQGRANAHAAVGDRLVVINQKSGRRIEGIVTETGAVRVP